MCDFASNPKLIQELDDIHFVNSTIPGGILIAMADADFTITHANQGYFDLVGYTREELYEKFQNKGVNTLDPQEFAGALRSFQQQVAASGSFSIKARLANKLRGYTWVHFSGRVCPQPDGPAKIYFLIVDISEHLELMEQLEKEQEFNRLISKLTHDVFFDYDIPNATIKFSLNFAKRFGVREVFYNFPQSLIDTGIIADDSLQFFEVVQKSQSVQEYELHLIQPDGRDVWYLLYYSAVYNEEHAPIRAVGKMVEITQQKQQIQSLTQKAQTDPLTKLFNKEEARLRIEEYLANHSASERSALMLIDIDNFKGVNDTLGHQFGDSVLTDISEKVRAVFRESDIIGRLGGDEFVVLLRNVKSETIITEKAKALTQAFRQTYSGVHNEYKVSGSIGIAVCPDHGTSFEVLYRLADSALYTSKRKGKDCFTIYNDEFSQCLLSQPNVLQQAERLEASYYSNDIIYNIFEMLYETKDLFTTVNRVLSIIGKEFNVDRCYIFEHSDDGRFSSNTYEWCAKGIASMQQTMQNIPVERMQQIYNQYSDDGIFCCSDISVLEEPMFRLLSQQGVKSTVHCALFNQGSIQGFVGFNACRARRSWRGEEIATLNYISKILSVFLGSKRIKYI